jgi:hypothetical protein
MFIPQGAVHPGDSINFAFTGKVPTTISVVCYEGGYSGPVDYNVTQAADSTFVMPSEPYSDCNATTDINKVQEIFSVA